MKYLMYIFSFLICFNKNSNYSLYKFEKQSLTQNLFIISKINWRSFLLETFKNSFFFESINSADLLLINMVHNDTDYCIQTTKITNTLIEVITNDIKPCKIINMEQLYHVHRDLGISTEEILNSYTFSIEIAHYLKANYIIYSIIYEDNENRLIMKLQLISSNTGEILNNIHKFIYYQNSTLN